MSKFFKFLATLGPIGYLPGSGTVATALTVPLVWVMEDLTFEEYLSIASIILLFAHWIIQRALGACDPKNHDPAEIVLDEVIGFIFVFIFIPITILSLAIAFVLFRLFDILKPFGIKKCENLVGALGIVADDLLAALFSGGILAFCVLLLEWF
jgi:phosphatidylglycerophosphatase A